MSSNASALPNQDENFAAADSAPDTSTRPGGIRARMRTSGVSVSASREKSRSASAAMSAAPGSVAEDGGVLIADPFPEGRRSCETRVRHEASLVQFARVEAD